MVISPVPHLRGARPFHREGQVSQFRKQRCGRCILAGSSVEPARWHHASALDCLQVRVIVAKKAGKPLKMLPETHKT